MARRSGGGATRKSGGEAESLAAVYEGPEVLSELLHRAGSPVSAEEAAERFAAAQVAGAERSEVIPTFFPQEPRFSAPEDARRLYSNLFGLWNRIASGLGPIDDVPEVVPEPESPPLDLPERGSVRCRVLTPDWVEAVWRYLSGLRERDQRRWRDRFQNAQSDLAAWLDELPLPETAALAAGDLAFETWAMFDRAFGDRLGVANWKDLKALEAEPPPLESEQPALASYAAEVLDDVADEDPSFGPEERAQVERVAATVAAALGQTVGSAVGSDP